MRKEVNMSLARFCISLIFCNITKEQRHLHKVPRVQRFPESLRDFPSSNLAWKLLNNINVSGYCQLTSAHFFLKCANLSIHAR